MTYQIFPDKYKFILDILEKEIEELPIPKKESRKDTAGIGRSIVFGLTKHRRETGLHLSAYSKKYPLIWLLLQTLAEIMKFDFSSVMINRNYKTNPHKDKNKPGTLNMIYGFSNYEGGELKYKNEIFDIKNKWLLFDGYETHSTEPFEGLRHSITFFTK